MPSKRKEAEFTEFVELHSDSLRRTAYLLAGNQQGAEDLLQDALVKAWLKWDRIDPETATAYVRKIMSNFMIDRWRRKRYEAVPVEIHESREDMHAAASFVDADHRDDIVRQLRNLTPRERTAVVLRYYHDLPEAEVAQLLGISVSTVKSTCSRALARLRSRNDAAKVTRSVRA